MISLYSATDNCPPGLGATPLVVGTEGATGIAGATGDTATGDAATGET